MTTVRVLGSLCPGRGRPPTCTEAERRRQLLETAETMFLTAGYHAATMDGIARQAGMSKRTLYQVFPSKAALFEALLSDRFLPLTIPSGHDARPLAEGLAGVLRHMADFCLAPRQIAIMRLMIAEAPLSRDMAEALDKLGLGRGNGVLEQWLAGQVAKGVLPAVRPDAANALFFTAIGEALLHSLLRLGEPPTPDLLDQRIGEAVRAFLNDATGRAAHP